MFNSSALCALHAESQVIFPDCRCACPHGADDGAEAQGREAASHRDRQKSQAESIPAGAKPEVLPQSPV